jgi:hypothetical protein
MPISQVAEGIMAKFTGSALSTLVGGRIWRDSAKQNETMPYIVFTCISNIQADTYNEDLEYQHWMFYIWTNDIDPSTATTGLDALESALRALFDNTVLTISGWTNLMMRWTNSRPAFSEDDNVIGIMIEYDTYIQNT